LDNPASISSIKGPAVKVPGSEGQVWNLSVINDKLFIGHHEGAFVYEDGVAKQLTSGAGHWNFIPINSKLLATGTYRGVKVAKTGNHNGWIQPTQSLQFESSRFLEFYGGMLWVSHPYKGIFNIHFTGKDSALVSEKVGPEKGIDINSKNYIFQIKNRLVSTSGNGILEYDTTRKTFKKSSYLDSLIPYKNIRFLKEDPWGNIWLIFDKNMVLVDLSGDAPQYLELTPFNNNLLSGFESLYFHDKENILLGKEAGFYLFNLTQYKTSSSSQRPLIRKVKLTGKEERYIFDGFEPLDQKTKQEIHPIWKDIHFDFSTPLIPYQDIIEYSVKLEGYETNWSLWNKRTDKEYTKLSPGKYTFKVRSKDHLGKIMESKGFEFEILPPWYRTGIAYFFYLLGIGTLLYLLRKYQQMSIQKTQRKHELERTKLKYLQQLEMDKAEKELVKLRNEKLETELELQHAELASATMHLVQKAEIINGIKEEMLKITRNYKSEISIPELKKLIRTLGDDEAIDSGWEQFAQHFDKVNSNFLVALKAKYPEITTTETKLCTYLRMNLSSKEIAQLMHITSKSVELSRYRLRKKLGLQKDEGLYDFLIKIGQEPDNPNVNK
jgi:DNA-binding CsgD family transcriptional regulator